jgi:hypothetical protein
MRIRPQAATESIGFVGERHADASEWSERSEAVLNL